MSVGRHRRKKGIVYGRKIEKDRRGNEQVVPDYERPQVTRMSKHAIRTNRSEIEGQLTNEVYTILVTPRPNMDIGPWTVIEFEGRKWDLTAPPIFREGRRHTRHWACEVRARPPSDLSRAVRV